MPLGNKSFSKVPLLRPSSLILSVQSSMSAISFVFRLLSTVLSMALVQNLMLLSVVTLFLNIDGRNCVSEKSL